MADAPRILGGRYEVGELIGRGGMAEVHIGHDTRLGRTVAVKILRSDLARDPSFQARFRREAQAAAALNHPAIVAVYDTGEDVSVEPSGAVSHVPFIVMEYVEGHTVRDILRDGAAVPIEEAAEITAGVLSALEYSHHAGIVHRDIKPANVMLTPAGAVKVMDFGIARAMADAAGTMTQTQAVIGTAQYLSPEQARGEQVDSRSDLYSTGCLLFELLTGRPPFVGDSPVAVAYQHAREVPQPPSAFASDVPEALDRITMKALAKDRDHRYASAAEFRADLEAALRGGHVGAPALGAAAGGAALGAAAATAATQRFEPPAAATQVMQPTTPAPVAPAAAPGWGAVGTQQGTYGGPYGGGPVPLDADDEEDGRKPWVLWVLIGVAIAAIIGIIFLLTRGDGDEPTVTEVEVPDVIGWAVDDAREEITDAGLRFRQVSEPNDAPAGEVVSTDPEAGELVEEGDTVVVTVSAGPNAIPVPDVKGRTQADARALLADAGFDPVNITVEPVDDPEVPKDMATGTDPAAGEEVARDTPIVLYISTGVVQLPPEIVGMTEADAIVALQERGLTPSVRYEPSDEPAGTVIRTEPGPGPVPQNSPVTLFVAEERVIETSVVPDVRGITYGQAAARLGQESLNAAPGEDRYDPDVPAGRVIETNPAIGSTVNEGTTVVVVVSLGPEPPPEGEGEGEGEGG